MKTIGKRMVHLRENVLKVTRERFSELTGVSKTPLIQIDKDEDAPRALEQVVERLGLNPEWVYKGKGEIFLTGTEAENVARMKAIKSQSGYEPWKDEAYQTMKTELDRAREREDRMQRIIDRLLNGGTNFRKALGNTSYRAKVA